MLLELGLLKVVYRVEGRNLGVGTVETGLLKIVYGGETATLGVGVVGTGATDGGIGLNMGLRVWAVKGRNY